MRAPAAQPRVGEGSAGVSGALSPAPRGPQESCLCDCPTSVPFSWGSRPGVTCALGWGEGQRLEETQRFARPRGAGWEMIKTRLGFSVRFMFPEEQKPQRGHMGAGDCHPLWRELLLH